jgi:hypothetical protein
MDRRDAGPPRRSTAARQSAVGAADGQHSAPPPEVAHARARPDAGERPRILAAVAQWPPEPPSQFLEIGARPYRARGEAVALTPSGRGAAW